MRSRPLSGRSILVVEDTSVIAIEIETILIAAGAERVVVAMSVHQAEAALASGPGFDALVVGMFLDRAVHDFVSVSAAAGRPLVLFAASPEGNEARNHLAGAVTIAKPYSEAELLAAVLRAIAGRDTIGG